MRAKQDACALHKPFSLLVKSAILCLRRADLAAVSGNEEEQRRRLEDFVHQVKNVIPQHQQYLRRKDDEHVRDLDAKVESALAQLRVMDDAEGAQDSSTESSIMCDDDGKTAGRSAISFQARQRAGQVPKREGQSVQSMQEICELRMQIDSVNEKVEEAVAGSREVAMGFADFRREIEGVLANKSNECSDAIERMSTITRKPGAVEQQSITAEKGTANLQAHLSMHQDNKAGEPDMRMPNAPATPTENQMGLFQSTISQMQSKFANRIGVCEDSIRSIHSETATKLSEMEAKISNFLNQDGAPNSRSRGNELNGNVVLLEDRLFEMEAKMSMMKVELEFLKKDRGISAGEVHQACQNIEILQAQQQQEHNESKSMRREGKLPELAQNGGLNSKIDFLLSGMQELQRENALLSNRLYGNEDVTRKLSKAIGNCISSEPHKSPKETHNISLKLHEAGGDATENSADGTRETGPQYVGMRDRSKSVDGGLSKDQSKSERKRLSETGMPTKIIFSTASESESRQQKAPHRLDAKPMSELPLITETSTSLFERMHDVEVKCRQLENAVNSLDGNADKHMSIPGLGITLEEDMDTTNTDRNSRKATQAQEKSESNTAHLKKIIQQAEAELRRLEETNERIILEWEELKASSIELQQQKQQGEHETSSSSAAATAAEMAVQAANAAAEAVKRAWARAEESAKAAEKAASIAAEARQQIEPIVARMDSLAATQRSIESVAVVAAKRAEVVENALCRTLNSVATARSRKGVKPAGKGVSLRVPALHGAYTFKSPDPQAQNLEKTLKTTREIAASAEAKCEAVLSKLSRPACHSTLANSKTKDSVPSEYEHGIYRVT